LLLENQVARVIHGFNHERITGRNVDVRSAAAHSVLKVLSWDTPGWLDV
jgi:hypothetical protein